MDVGVIIAGVVSFVSVILALVAILSFAKSKLVSSEAVTIGINGDPTKALKTKLERRFSTRCRITSSSFLRLRR